MKLLKHVITSRSATFELETHDAYYSKDHFAVYLDGKCVKSSYNKNVFSLYHLVGGKNYHLKVEFDGGTHVECNFETPVEWIALDVRKFGAVGDGVHDDTRAIQAAIAACPHGSTVIIPKGTYYVSPLFLKSNMTLYIDQYATLKAHTDRKHYGILPGYIMANDEKSEYLLGTWEGNPLDMFASLLTGIHVENVNIIGEGCLDGNGDAGDWWQDVKKKRGAWRPRIVFLKGCRNIVMQGITLTNSPCWTVHPYLSHDIRFVDLFIKNGKDSPNTDGIDPESCSKVQIIGVHFSVGDDCIAIKSGKLYMGKTYNLPCENLVIRNCLMEHGHGAVVIGSEMSGGVKNLVVEKCIFNDTDRGLRIKTRRGRGKNAVVEHVKFKNIIMSDVLTPFVINMHYFCDPDGHTPYVYSRDKLKVDDWTPRLGSFEFEDITCTGGQFAAGYFIGLPEQPIDSISLKNVSIVMSELSQPGFPAMMDYVDPVCRMGLNFEYVDSVYLENVQISNHLGDHVLLHDVKQFVEEV